MINKKSFDPSTTHEIITRNRKSKLQIIEAKITVINNILLLLVNIKKQN